MTPEPAYYYDVNCSRRRNVILTVDGNTIHILGEDIDITHPLIGARLSPPLGRTRRSIYLSNGSKCEINDGHFATQLARQLKGKKFYSALHNWERSLTKGLFALVLTIAVLWGFMRYGIPILARQVAYSVPPATENAMGKEALELLDHLIFKPSTLPETRREEISVLFNSVITGFDLAQGRLEFRSAADTGPNAFALPSGIIIMTDELIAVADNDEEIVAVLAHEAAHVRHRHTLRQTLQKSATALIIAALTGDVTSVTSITASIPAVLAEARFSRNLEREADSSAVLFLKDHDISVQHYANILLKIDNAYRPVGNDSPSLLDRILSTHPDTAERVRALQTE